MSKEKENSLVDFEWESTTDEFFGEKSEETKLEDEFKKEIESEEDVSEESEEERVEEVEEKVEEEFFTDEEKKETKESDNNIWNDFYKDLKEKGIVNIDLEEGEEISPEKIIELSQAEIDTQVKTKLESWADDLDDDAKKFIKYKLEGGSTKKFFDTIQKVSFDEGDIEDEKYQDNVIRKELSLEGFDEEEIEDRLEYLTETGKKKTTAKRYEKRSIERKEAEKEKLIEEEAKFKEQQKKKKMQYKQSVKSFLEEKNSLGPFDLNEKEKDVLYDFMTKEKNGVTPFQEALTKVFADENKTAQLAKILKDDFNFDSLSKKLETEKTKKIKTNISKHSKSRNFGSSYGKKSLADLLE